MKICCGLPMSTLEVFGIRIYQCMHRSHHPRVFENLQIGQTIEETEVEWVSHYGGEREEYMPVAVEGQSPVVPVRQDG